MKEFIAEAQLNLYKFSELSTTSKQAEYSDFLSSININENFYFEKFDNYNIDAYRKDIAEIGLNETWKYINYYLLNYYNSKNKFLKIQNLADLYEIGLALENKNNKKVNGQYYTPDDVAYVMANWFKDLKGENICDVACGTGKLILAFFEIIGQDAAVEIIKNRRLYLYDLDETALSICKTILLLKYGKDLSDYINAVHCDFLSNSISLPANCKVISNPPYSTVKYLSLDWDKTKTAIKTKELYAMFIEKIIKQSESSVIISPYSFLGGSKFYPLREIMNDYNGFIVSFDNVPGNIFCGKKQGIFNTNTANSVRASITVVENLEEFKGFKISPLIRFKNIERKILLKCDVLESFVSQRYQIISKQHQMYLKCFKDLEVVWDAWQNKSKSTLGEYVSQYGQYILSMPNTCRYYTTASKGIMNRRGQIVLRFEDESVFYFVFCLINSSFAYWYWRLFDGGITYTKKLLLSLPVFFDILTAEDKKFFKETANEMINISSNFIITKNNVGVQENIKFPSRYRDKINRKILDILGLDISEKVFDVVHSNMALEVNV